ncbi:MAG: carboxylesterase family protein [Alphaproteobacteria bacterium]|nr:carboxylesterase family protein [Alphaproteobacteria bacterium]
MDSIWFRAGVAAVLALFLVAVANAVEIEGGRIEGVKDGDLTVYKGVPFAAPPTGALRWRAPQPVRPWSGVRRAEAFAPACMQVGVSMPGEAPPAISEDCLYLNVWTPAGFANEKLPVLVWIYGGGFANGSAAMPLYWGDRLARKGIVVVTIAYRVGAFGFLAHPELTREPVQHASGNYGLMDQIAALKWVRANIAAFGGDDRRVTIAGQSAGAMSVSILMASPLAKGLFARAIGQSGGFFEPVQLAPGFLLANAERDGVVFAASVGASSLAALRQVPAAALLKGKSGPVSHPVIEPYVLPETPYDVFAAGRQSDVPILIGVNAEEARALVDVKNVTAAGFAGDIEKAFGALPPPLIAAYAPGSDVEAPAARIAFETDLRFGWNIWAWARLHAARGKGDVFSYRFTQRPPFPDDSVYAGWGASHFAELWYMFGHLDQAPWRWSAGDRRVEAAMMAYWVNFVRGGNPNGNGVPAWPAFKDANGPVLALGEPISPAAVSGVERLKVFDAVYAQLRRAPMP